MKSLIDVHSLLVCLACWQHPDVVHKNKAYSAAGHKEVHKLGRNSTAVIASAVPQNENDDAEGRCTILQRFTDMRPALENLHFSILAASLLLSHASPARS